MGWQGQEGLRSNERIFMSYMKKYTDKFNKLKEIIAKKDPVIVEIGAHYGEDSLRFAEAFPESSIFCFEPDPRNISVFKKYVCDDRIKLFEVALSDRVGCADFYQSYQSQTDVPEKYDWISRDDYINLELNNSGSSSLKKGYKHIKDKITVKTDTYANFVEKNKINYVDLLWIDVQGAEKEVLTGCGDHLYEVKLVIVEYGEKEYDGYMDINETINFLSAFGFKPIINDGNDLWLLNLK